jgi:phasin
MATPPNIEVPEAFRQMAEQNVAQARQAYEQFMTMARQAQEMMNKSAGAMSDATRDVQSKTMSFAEQNMEAGFAFMNDLSRARDLKEFLDIQNRHAQSSMKTYAEQAQELGRLMTEAAKKGQR